MTRDETRIFILPHTNLRQKLYSTVVSVSQKSKEIADRKALFHS